VVAFSGALPLPSFRTTPLPHTNPRPHDSHHKFTQLRKDEMRTSKMQYKWHLLNGLLFQPTVARGVMINGEYCLRRPPSEQFPAARLPATSLVTGRSALPVRTLNAQCRHLGHLCVVFPLS
jgi:hypothetical protein